MKSDTFKQVLFGVSSSSVSFRIFSVLVKAFQTRQPQCLPIPTRIHAQCTSSEVLEPSNSKGKNSRRPTELLHCFWPSSKIESDTDRRSGLSLTWKQLIPAEPRVSRLSSSSAWTCSGEQRENSVSRSLFFAFCLEEGVLGEHSFVMLERSKIRLRRHGATRNGGMATRHGHPWPLAWSYSCQAAAGLPGLSR